MISIITRKTFLLARHSTMIIQEENKTCSAWSQRKEEGANTLWIVAYQTKLTQWSNYTTTVLYSKSKQHHLNLQTWKILMNWFRNLPQNYVSQKIWLFKEVKTVTLSISWAKELLRFILTTPDMAKYKTNTLSLNKEVFLVKLEFYFTPNVQLLHEHKTIVF